MPASSLFVELIIILSFKVLKKMKLISMDGSTLRIENMYPVSNF